MANKRYLYSWKTKHGVLVGDDSQIALLDVSKQSSVVSLFREAHRCETLCMQTDPDMLEVWDPDNAQRLYRDVTKGTPLYIAWQHLDRKKISVGREIVRLICRLCLLIVLIVAVLAVLNFAFKRSVKDAIELALVFYPLLWTAWYYSTKEKVSGPQFNKLTCTERINLVSSLLGLVMPYGVYVWYELLPLIPR